MTNAAAGAAPAVRSPWRTRWLLGGVVFVVHGLSPIPQSGDSRMSAITGWQFLHHFSLDLRGYPQITALTEQGDLWSVHGHLVPFFPWPPMLLTIPADLLVAALSPGGRLPTGLLPEHTFFVEVPTASLVVALTTVLLRELIAGLSTALVTSRVALLTALLFAFGSSAWSVGSRALWQQTVSMLLITAAMLALHRIGTSHRAAVLLGVWIGLAVAVRPTNAVVAVLLVALLSWRTVRPHGLHRAALLPVLLGGLAVGVPFLAYSRWQYGTFLPPYYQLTRLTDPPRYGFGESILVNLVSPSRGLLFFDPVIVLAVIGVVIRARRRLFTPVDGLLVAAIVGQLLLIGKYGSTHGFTYGPRLMIDVLPMLMVLAAPALTGLGRPGPGLRTTPARRLRAAGLIALIGWSLFVNASGAISRAGVCWNSDPVSVDLEPARVWDFSDPQFLRPLRAVVSGESIHEVILGHCRG